MRRPRGVSRALCGGGIGLLLGSMAVQSQSCPGGVPDAFPPGGLNGAGASPNDCPADAAAEASDSEGAPSAPASAAAGTSIEPPAKAAAATVGPEPVPWRSWEDVPLGLRVQLWITHTFWQVLFTVVDWAMTNWRDPKGPGDRRPLDEGTGTAQRPTGTPARHGSPGDPQAPDPDASPGAEPDTLAEWFVPRQPRSLLALPPPVAVHASPDFGRKPAPIGAAPQDATAAQDPRDPMAPEGLFYAQGPMEWASPSSVEPIPLTLPRPGESLLVHACVDTWDCPEEPRSSECRQVSAGVIGRRVFVICEGYRAASGPEVSGQHPARGTPPPSIDAIDRAGTP